MNNLRQHRVRWLGHTGRMPHDVMVVKLLLLAHSIPGHPRPMGHLHLMWMDTTMHEVGSLDHTLQMSLPPSTRLGDLAVDRDVWRGWSAGAEVLVVLVAGFCHRHPTTPRPHRVLPKAPNYP